MAIICPSCGQQFDVALFQFDSVVVCDCGAVVGEELGRAAAELEGESREELAELARMSDRVCAVILDERCSEAEVEAEIAGMRDEVLRRYPHRCELFSMLYESRFRRLREQFRSREGGDADPPDSFPGETTRGLDGK